MDMVHTEAIEPITGDPKAAAEVAALFIQTNVLVVRAMGLLGESIDPETITPRMHGADMAAFIGQLARGRTESL